MKKIIVTIAIVLVLAAAGVATWLLASGKVALVLNQNTSAAAPKLVCDSAIVNTFNDAMFYTIRGGGSTVSIDKEGLIALVAKIKATSGYDSDPTCQTILYLSAVYNQDYNAAKAASDAVKQLHDKGMFADNNIRGNQPLFMYESSIYSFSPEGKTQGGVSGE